MTEPSRIIIGDVIDGLRTLDAGSVHCCVTSPPYWGLRDYGVEGQIGLEKTPDEFVAKMVEVFREVRRVLREDGTLWLNLGDSYAGSWGAQSRGPTTPGTLEAHDMLSARQIAAARREDAGTGSLKRTPGLKQKDLCMIPWRVALALQADGWWLRSVICWAKKSPMPESVTDRPTSSWEPIFLLAKGERYFYDAEAVKEKSDTTVSRKTKPTDEYAHGMTPGEVVGRPVQRGGKSLAYAYPNGIPFRNQRNVWHLGPEPFSGCHFATFPTEIPRRAIKAGTSEKGCCAACGAPWARVVERKNCDRTDASEYAAGLGDVATARTRTACNFRNGITTSVGWEPGCTCGADVVPCMVLDPFLGSGTTVAVARELGRYGVGCELNPEYAALARERIGKAEKPATFRSDRVIDSPLFGGVA